MSLPSIKTRPVLRILGTRGIPAAHGGFETFAEQLAIHLASHGWEVVVYCQVEGAGELYEDDWCGIRRVCIPIKARGPRGTIVFDFLSIVHASRSQGLCLTLGYNTAIFCSILRLRGVRNIINMDGIEWSRAKWSPVARLWFWMNDWLGCWLGDHLVADHPEIKAHLCSRVRQSKVTTIAYGAVRVDQADVLEVTKLGLLPWSFLTVIARPEPENSLLEVVSGFSKRRRGFKLVVLGAYDHRNRYHQQVMAAASDEVVFVGAIYDKNVVNALRFYSYAYVHGHQVGGTNPSLVEALGAGNAVIAHDNRFNRWVASDSAVYFKSAVDFDSCFERLCSDLGAVERLRTAAVKNFNSRFTWSSILCEYQSLLEHWLSRDRK